jgi:hypothetical protein
VTGLSMLSIQYARAADYLVTASVPGTTITSAAIITNPADGSTVQSTQATIHGTCQVVNTGTVVTLVRGSTMIGSGLCQADSTFDILVSLNLGDNAIFPEVETGTGVPGPDGQVVHVYYVLPPEPVAPTPMPTPTQPVTQGSGASVASGNMAGVSLLQIQPQSSLGGPGDTFVEYPAGHTAEITFILLHGTSPFTIVTDWGDGHIETIQQASAGVRITLRHVYETVGAHTVVVKASDAAGSQAVLQFVAITSAALSLAPPTATVVTPRPDATAWLRSTQLVWTASGMLCMVLIGLWLVSPQHTMFMRMPAFSRVRIVSATKRGKPGRRDG